MRICKITTKAQENTQVPKHVAKKSADQISIIGSPYFTSEWQTRGVL